MRGPDCGRGRLSWCRLAGPRCCRKKVGFNSIRDLVWLISDRRGAESRCFTRRWECPNVCVTQAPPRAPSNPPLDTFWDWLCAHSYKVGKCSGEYSLRTIRIVKTSPLSRAVTISQNASMEGLRCWSECDSRLVWFSWSSPGVSRPRAASSPCDLRAPVWCSSCLSRCSPGLRCPVRRWTRPPRRPPLSSSGETLQSGTETNKRENGSSDEPGVFMQLGGNMKEPLSLFQVIKSYFIFLNLSLIWNILESKWLRGTESLGSERQAAMNAVWSLDNLLYLRRVFQDWDKLIWVLQKLCRIPKEILVRS